MEVGVWCGAGILVLYNIVLQIKVYLLRKSAKEIRKDFQKLLKTNTNTIIQISSRDREMCAEKISNSDLDFKIQYESDDELGQLCRDFEVMRSALAQNFSEMWRQVEERKRLNGAFAHDLRTPLTAIYGYLNLLKKEECPEHIKRYLDAIENRAQALKQLTEELFRYTIVISEAEEMTLQVLTLNGILESSISVYYSVLKQNHIVPEISISDQQITGRVNENALSRVLGNILSNAVKYSDGDLKIVLSEDGEIRISNHASGLSEVQAERLFDRFYTVNTARKSTGLGLSIAKALMEKMGGTITADYRENVLEICVNVQKL